MHRLLKTSCFFDAKSARRAGQTVARLERPPYRGPGSERPVYAAFTSLADFEQSRLKAVLGAEISVVEEDVAQAVSASTTKSCPLHWNKVESATCWDPSTGVSRP